MCVSQCPKCGERVKRADSLIAAALAKLGGAASSGDGGGPRVGDLLPKCPTCQLAVFFSGCGACGMLFTDRDWESLPVWDPAARDLLKLDSLARGAARLIVAQVMSHPPTFPSHSLSLFPHLST